MSYSYIYSTLDVSLPQLLSLRQQAASCGRCYNRHVILTSFPSELPKRLVDTKRPNFAHTPFRPWPFQLPVMDLHQGNNDYNPLRSKPVTAAMKQDQKHIEGSVYDPHTGQTVVSYTRGGGEGVVVSIRLRGRRNTLFAEEIPQEWERYPRHTSCGARIDGLIICLHLYCTTSKTKPTSTKKSPKRRVQF